MSTKRVTDYGLVLKEHEPSIIDYGEIRKLAFKAYHSSDVAQMRAALETIINESGGDIEATNEMLEILKL